MGLRGGLLVLLLLSFGCSSPTGTTASSTPKAAAPAATPSPAPTTAAAPAQQGPETLDQLAQAFSGQPSFDDTRAVVAFGPRPPASPAHKKTVDYILRRLKSTSARVQLDSFTAATPRGPMPMTNIVAKFGQGPGQILLVGGHYDTKFLPGFVGANDGGSSTGILLGLADVLSKARLQKQVWLVFLDGEEAIHNEWTDADSVYGSKHFVQLLQQRNMVPRIGCFILADMIGDRSLDITRETNSTAWLVDFVRTAETSLGDQAYFFKSRMDISDDHGPFLAAGIPSVDLIDFTYGPGDHGLGYWHTPQDTMDKLSPTSFKIVGSVILKTLALLERQ